MHEATVFVQAPLDRGEPREEPVQLDPTAEQVVQVPLVCKDELAALVSPVQLVRLDELVPLVMMVLLVQLVSNAPSLCHSDPCTVTTCIHKLDFFNIA